VEDQERRHRLSHSDNNMGGGGQGSINIPFIYTDIQGVVGDPGDPLSLHALGRGKRRPSLPMGDPMGAGGLPLEDCWERWGR